MAKHRTSLLLDTELMTRAAHVLGTSSKTDTVKAALEGAIQDVHLKNLVAWEMADTAEQDLQAQRRPRDFS